MLLLILLLPLLVLPRRRQKGAALRFSNKELLKGLGRSPRLALRRWLPWLRAAALFFLILGLARPQIPLQHERINRKGIDIILAVDISSSMEALDFKLNGQRYNRLYVIKQVVNKFVRERPNDRFGMIAFAGRPYVACPLTLDHNWLLDNLARVKIGMVEDGTAIGSSIMAGLNRLRKSKAKTKIIILLTDGRNNAGKISPLSAAEAAKALGVKIYTIGAGGKGEVPFPVTDAFGQQTVQMVKIDIDEGTLKKIARITGGEYFRAQDTASLKDIYEQINRMHKTAFKEAVFLRFKEIFPKFLLIGMVLLLLEQLLGGTVFLKIP